MWGIKLKYKSSAFQTYFNCYQNILVKYNSLPYKMDGIVEFHNKMWKIGKMSSKSKKNGPLPHIS